MGNANQERLRLYIISNDYLEYLRQIEPKVPLNKDGKKSRPFVGVVLCIGGNDYFAPLSSKKHNKRSDVKIIKSGEQIATVRCSFMLPVPKGVLQEIDFTQEMIKDRRYAAILINEIQYLNEETVKKKLFDTALKTYNYCTNRQYGFDKFCCDFKVLEQYAKDYDLI